MRQADVAGVGTRRFDHRDRIGHQRRDRQRLVGDAVDERGVGAVLQQPTHQIRQQCLVTADRRVDAARPAQLAFGNRSDDLVVQRLAHAVQALEFVLALLVIRTGEVIDRGQGVRVVRRELRVDRLRRGQQLSRAGEIRHVGVHLARVDRIVLQPVELGAFDFAVPIGALHQADHEPVATAARQIDQIGDDAGTTLLVRLNHEADAVPACERRLVAEALQQVERDFEPIGFFGVDVQTDVVAAREQCQRAQAWIELVHDARMLGAAVARMQRRQLDRDARPAIDADAGRSHADRVDRLLVRRHVAQRVGIGERRLAEHVVRIAEAARLQLAGVGQRLADGFAGDKLLAHQAHRHVHALAHHRFSAARQHPSERTAEPRFVVRRHQFAGQHQAPGGGIDEQRRALAQVRLPVAGADLVADERIARAFVRYAQKRFGQAHQRHAFLRRQGKLLQQVLHDAGPTAGLVVAQLLRQFASQRVRGGCHADGQPCLGQQHRDLLRLGSAVRGGNGGAQHALRQQMLCEIEEGLVFALDRGLRLNDGARCSRQVGGCSAENFVEREPALQHFQVRVDRLLDEPMRRVSDLDGSGLQPLPDAVIELHAHGGQRHDALRAQVELRRIVRETLERCNPIYYLGATFFKIATDLVAPEKFNALRRVLQPIRQPDAAHAVPSQRAIAVGSRSRRNARE